MSEDHEEDFRALMQELVAEVHETLDSRDSRDDGKMTVTLKDVFTRQLKLIAAMTNLYATVSDGSEGLSRKADTTLIALLTTINSLTNNGTLSDEQRSAIFDVLRRHEAGSDVPDTPIVIDNPDAKLFAIQADLSFLLVDDVRVSYEVLLEEGIHPDDAIEVVRQFYVDKFKEFKDEMDK